MVYSLGMGKSGITSFEDINEVRDLISESTKEKLEKEVEEIIRQCADKAHDLLHRNKGVLDALVKELLERETLNRNEVQEIIERAKKGS